MIVTYDGNVLKDEEKFFTLEKAIFPENVTFDYQSAMASSELFNYVYQDIIKTFNELSSNIEAHRSLREVVKRDSNKGFIC